LRSKFALLLGIGGKKAYKKKGVSKFSTLGDQVIGKAKNG
jgi:hypothetical protein